MLTSPNNSLQVLVDKTLSKLDLPSDLEDATSSKMLMNISCDNKEWNSSLISDQKITFNNIKEFMYLSIKEITPSCDQVDLSFGILLKFNNEYFGVDYILSNYGNHLGSKTRYPFTHRWVKDKFKIWSSIIQSNNGTPQIDDDGNFI